MKDYMYDVYFNHDGNPRKHHTCEDVYIDGERVSCKDYKTNEDGALTLRIEAYNPNIIAPMTTHKIKLLGFDGDFCADCNGVVNQFGQVITNLQL